jgi:site-specific DNA recombinase
VTYVQAPKIRHIDCNELARSLLPGCLVYFLSVRSVAKDRARTARNRAPTERCQDKRREVRGGQAPRIIGSKSELLRTRVAASSGKTAGFGVTSFVPKWRAGQVKTANTYVIDIAI